MRHKAAALVVGVGLVLAGCGFGDEDSQDSGESAAAPMTTASARPTPAASMTTRTASPPEPSSAETSNSASPAATGLSVEALARKAGCTGQINPAMRTEPGHAWTVCASVDRVALLVARYDRAPTKADLLRRTKDGAPGSWILIVGDSTISVSALVDEPAAALRTVAGRTGGKVVSGPELKRWK